MLADIKAPALRHFEDDRLMGGPQNTQLPVIQPLLPSGIVLPEEVIEGGIRKGDFQIGVISIEIEHIEGVEQDIQLVEPLLLPLLLLPVGTGELCPGYFWQGKQHSSQ